MKFDAIWLFLSLLCIYSFTAESLEKSSPDSKPLPAFPKVNVTVLFRAFCPACKFVISSPLTQLYQDTAFHDIVNLVAAPIAGMKQLPDGELKCTSGLTECDGHRWFQCAIEEDVRHPQVYLEILSCLKSSRRWKNVLPRCAKTPERLKRMQDCYEQKSVSLLVDIMHQYQHVKVQWMPYMLINGQVLGTNKKVPNLKMIKDAICEAFEGDPHVRKVIMNRFHSLSHQF